MSQDRPVNYERLEAEPARLQRRNCPQAQPLGSQLDRVMRRLLKSADAALRLGVLTTLRLALFSPRRLPAALRAARRDASLRNRQYAVLLRKRELTPSRMAAISEEIKSFSLAPTISLLMPVFNIERNWLEAAVNSVAGQLYPHWQLCIADDASTSPYIGPFIAELAARDSRIRVVRLSANEGISGASNRAFEMATGDFVAPMDHDDVLAPDALYEVVKRINADPSIDFVYTDHDVRDANGVRRHPFFKPDWSPDLLLSMNYVTPFLRLSARAGRTGRRDSARDSRAARTTTCCCA